MPLKAVRAAGRIAAVPLAVVCEGRNYHSENDGLSEQLGCGECNEGWICEDHPDQPMGHQHCGGAGMPCQNPACAFSVERTGLVCPKCRRSQGEIEMQTDRVVRFKCRSCSYQWWAENTTAENRTTH